MLRTSRSALFLSICALALTACSNTQLARENNAEWVAALERNKALLTPDITAACRDKILANSRVIEERKPLTTSVTATKIALMKNLSYINKSNANSANIFVLVGEFDWKPLGLLTSSGHFGCMYNTTENRLDFVKTLGPVDFTLP